MVLDTLFGSNKEKSQEKVEEHYQKGISFIEGKMYNQALFEFKQALSLDRENVYQRLKDDLENFSRFGQIEAALAVGLNILQENQNDAELANQLGNFSRQLSNYKQANNLYKHALKKDKNFEFAFYNLAASMARIEKYDDDVISAIKNFDKYNDYILPEYIGGPDLIDKISEEILEHKKERTEEKIQALTLELEEKSTSLDLDEGDVDHINHQIEELKANISRVTDEEILSYFVDQIQKGHGNSNELLYNQGLYALSVHQPEIANECLVALFKENARFKYLRMNIALANAQLDKYEEATNTLVRLLGESRYDRYYNVNLGLMYRKMGKRLLSYKYLVIAAWLLEQSDGIFNMSDMLKLADQKFEEERYKDAIKLYRVIVNEKEDVNILAKIGEIHLRQNRLDDALTSFKRIQAIDADSPVAKSKLQEIHSFYISKYEELVNEAKYKPALKNVLKALEVIRDVDTIQKAISVSRQMKRGDLEKKLTEELEQIKDSQKEAEKEQERVDLINAAAMAVKQKNYLKAIDFYEKAFRMRLDKNIFLQLAGLYKGLKKITEMEDLLHRWNKMVEYEEKMKKFKKLQDRSKTADEEGEE